MKRKLRIVLVAGLVLVSAAAASLSWLAFTDAGDAEPHPFNQDRNATWLEHRWLEKPHPVAEMEALFTALDGHGISYVFPHIIPFNGTGRLPVHDREQMRLFLATARRVAPRVRVVPWVGGLRSGYKRQRPGTIELANLAQRQRIVAECRGLIDEGFDGVHLNIEPIDDGNDDYLALLAALRLAVGEEHILSVSATRPGLVAPPFARNFFWTPDYYRRVARSADQLVVMAYDTALPTVPLYRRYLAWSSELVANTLHEGRARVLIGVPTYDATGLMHRPGIETIDNALLGVVQGLRGVGTGGTFEGVALYAEWTTDEAEWAIYEKRWRGRP